MKSNKRFFFILVIVLASCRLFIACSDNKELADYLITGTITDNTTLLPIKHIQVIRKSTEYLLFSDTTYTDSIGKYSFEFSDYYNKKASFALKIEDIDLTQNLGDFNTKEIIVGFTAADWDNDTKLNSYKAQAFKTVDIRLTKK
jgi:putative lipoprotein (rSAM/lipoprotein system)